MMNNRGHLPAGQPHLQGSVDMGASPVHGGGPRRGGRHPQHFAPQHAHNVYQQHANQYMFAPQAQSYGQSAYGGPNPYYSIPPPPPYQNGVIASQGYMGYPPAAFERTSPAMPQYPPMVAHGSYSRLPQQSPIVSSPYQPPPVLPATGPGVMAPTPLTPTSTQSSQLAQPVMNHIVSPSVDVMVLESPLLPPQSESEPQEPVVRPPPSVQEETSPIEVKFSPCVRLPWLSRPDESFPRRTPRSRRPRRIISQGYVGVEGLSRTTPDAVSETHGRSEEDGQSKHEDGTITPTSKVVIESPEARNARSDTPSTQDHPSELDGASSSPTTPSSLTPGQVTDSITVATKSIKPATRSALSPAPGQISDSITVTPKGLLPATRSALPPVPVVPALPRISPRASPKSQKSTVSSDRDSATETGASEKAKNEHTVPLSDATTQHTVSPLSETTGDGTSDSGTVSGDTLRPALVPAPAPTKPLLWSNLFSKAQSTVSSVKAPTAGDAPQVNGRQNGNAPLAVETGSNRASSNSLAEVLETYRIGNSEKLAFLEPRGLNNTGNMCYMNSILQVLLFCVPFYNFLDQVSKKATHSFKSETPILDAMVMFMREFKSIDSAVSVDLLRRRLKSEELEQYGEPFTPELVYEAIRSIPRFAHMKRGHQQDAQEFLGFLLDGLHDECVRVVRAVPGDGSSSLPSPAASSKNGFADGHDWLEVGRRQRPAVTRSSGLSDVLTPITKMFGGQLRSELRVPGLKNSVTLEPYQPLQLDIGAPDVRNIVDALKKLTRPEVMHGDFNSPYGKDAKTTKQIFIESLPPVLILHLKRFQFDAEGHGTMKIWKKVGYPLELELPRDVLSRQKRNTSLGEAAPQYRLIAVVYHHGKNASGGHYTVDVRRQDGREWIRLDDTVIRRVRSEDVAEGGAEEDAKTSATESRRENGSAAPNNSNNKNNDNNSNRFVGTNDEEAGEEEGWKQAPAGGKKWSSVVNGAPSTTAVNGKAKQAKDHIKDNKVAYLLFYERI